MCYTAPRAARKAAAPAPHLPRRLFVGSHSAPTSPVRRAERVRTHAAASSACTHDPRFQADAFSPMIGESWTAASTAPSQDSVIGMLVVAPRRSWCAADARHRPSRGRSTATFRLPRQPHPENARFSSLLSNGWRATRQAKRQPSSARCSDRRASGQGCTGVFFGEAMALLSRTTGKYRRDRSRDPGRRPRLACRAGGHRVTQGIVERIVPKKKARS